MYLYAGFTVMGKTGKISKSHQSMNNGYHDIVHWIRGNIYGGRLKPSDKLPSQMELTKKFGVSNQTVQRAIAHLKRQGLVLPCQKTGSLISEKASMSPIVGLALPETFPPYRKESIYWNCLATTAKSMKSDRFSIRPYFGLELWHPISDIKKLISDMKGHEINGIIFPADIKQLDNTPVMSLSGIPRIFITAIILDDYYKKKYDGFIIIPCMIEETLLWAARSGCKRVAVMTELNSYEDTSKIVERLAHDYGLTIKPHWIMGMDIEKCTLPIRRFTNFLFSSEKANRPEALIVLDDNMLKLAVQGIMDAGLSVPDDVLLISHSNFPNPVECPLPVKRFGVDVRTLLEKSVEMIRLYWKNGSMPPPIKAPFVTGD